MTKPKKVKKTVFKSINDDFMIPVDAFLQYKLDEASRMEELWKELYD